LGIIPIRTTEVFSIFQQINLAEATQRSDFRKRMENNQGVSLAEVCYGVLMGLESLTLHTAKAVGFLSG
jgi:tyrosyl-tRNA synthetase